MMENIMCVGVVESNTPKNLNMAFGAMVRTATCGGARALQGGHRRV